MTSQLSLFSDEHRIAHGTGKPELLEEVREGAIACRACDCWANRHHSEGVVMSDGPPDAAIMLVSEAPGKTESETGRPFTGRAGEELNKILVDVEIPRANLFICNQLKCWVGEGNPTPTAKQIKACFPFLARQIVIVSPKVIAAVGLVSTKALTGEAGPMRSLHGRTLRYGTIPVVPTYHPAALLHARDPGLSKVMRDCSLADWRVIKLLAERS